MLTVRIVRCYSIIVSVRETCADWQRGVEPQADPALKGKKDPDNGFGIKVPRRNVGNFFPMPCILCNNCICVYNNQWLVYSWFANQYCLFYTRYFSNTVKTDENFCSAVLTSVICIIRIGF